MDSNERRKKETIGICEFENEINFGEKNFFPVGILNLDKE